MQQEKPFISSRWALLLSFVLLVFLLLVSLLLVNSGCREREKDTPPTPTPFSAMSKPDRAPAGEAIPISLTNLSRNPELFSGATLQLRGQFQPLPKLICQQDAFPSPATWGLIAEGLQANATGLDEQLRQLLAVGQEITVEGLWLRHVGPVGCGKEAPVQEIWYLSVSRVVDPQPLVRATSALGPVPEEPTVIAEVPATETTAVTEEPTEQFETETPEATEELPPSPEPPSPQPPVGPGEGYPAGTASPPPTPITATPVGTGTAVTSTATATSNGTPATATATSPPNGSTATPAASATPGGGATTPKGPIDYEDLIIGSLANGAVDDWTFTVDNSDSITITLAPAASANMLFSVLDDSGQIVLDRQNQAAAGEVETAKNLNLTEPGTYHIHVAAEPAEETDYALMVMDSSSYAFSFRGTLAPGVQRSDALTADNDHFWFFPANDGETIRLQITPNGEADAYVELYGPDGARLMTLDDAGSGEAELLEDHSILESGLYAVRIGEFDFGAMTYQIVMDKT